MIFWMLMTELSIAKKLTFICQASFDSQIKLCETGDKAYINCEWAVNSELLIWDCRLHSFIFSEYILDISFHISCIFKWNRNFSYLFSFISQILSLFQYYNIFENGDLAEWEWDWRATESKFFLGCARIIFSSELWVYNNNEENFSWLKCSLRFHKKTML